MITAIFITLGISNENADKMIGKDFVAGLSNLKALVEKPQEYISWRKSRQQNDIQENILRTTVIGRHGLTN